MHRIALNVREQGRGSGQTGRLRSVQGMGWWLDEANLAQVSLNITDHSITPLHVAFNEASLTCMRMDILFKYWVFLMCNFRSSKTQRNWKWASPAPSWSVWCRSARSWRRPTSSWTRKVSWSWRRIKKCALPSPDSDSVPSARSFQGKRFFFIFFHVYILINIWGWGKRTWDRNPVFQILHYKTFY